LADQPPGQLGAIQTGHVDVQQQQLRMLFGTGGEHGLAIRDTGHQLDIIAVAQQRTQACARQGFVIGDQDFHDGLRGRNTRTT
jgi:hypothetical protein